jgi:hypothetical protein
MIVLALWAQTVTSDLERAGYQVGFHRGYPLAVQPSDFWNRCQLIEFEPSVPAEKFLMGNGVLFAPPQFKPTGGTPL